jgi:putative transposase
MATDISRQFWLDWKQRSEAPRLFDLALRRRRPCSADVLLVGGSPRQAMTRDIVIDALHMVWFKRHPNKDTGLILHSDRGSQDASKDFRGVLTDCGITASMSGRGDCWDKACSETLNGSLKVERVHGQRFKTRRHAMDEVVAWLLWSNRTRRHSTPAYVSPMPFEENWLTDQPRQASA